MKRIILYFILVLPTFIKAQTNVTFSVDMRTYVGSYSAVYVNGTWNNWCGTCNPMSDSDGDSIWTATLPLSVDSIEFKFTLDGWTGQENLISGTSCTKTTGIYTNRFASFNSDTTFPIFCWEKCTPCTGVSAPSTSCTDLFFSEYSEGSSNNKYYEIYNPTGTTIDLSDYEVRLFSNGGTTASQVLEFYNGITLASGDVYVIANYNADTTILAFADTTSTTTYYNGDDALVLLHDLDTLDIIGIVGVDPGQEWSVGTGATKENTLVRKLAVSAGTTDWTQSATQWDAYAQNTWTFGGEHSSNCFVTPSQVTFSVDMRNVTSSFANVYVSGTFDNWAGTSNQLSDANGDGIYEGTLSLNSGYYEYKYLYDNWNGQEYFNSSSLDSLCTVVSGVYINRVATIGSSDTVLPITCWEECVSCDTFTGTEWYVSTNGNDQNPGTSALPFLTVQTAIDSAVSGDRVFVESGSYGSFLIDKNITVIGLGSSKPIIDGGDSTRCIEIINTKASIQNLSLVDGYAPQTYNGNRGACLYAQYDSIWVENCDFYGGYASGGGDYYGGGGLPTFVNCRFLDNTTAGTQYLGSMFFVDNGQSANFYNCWFDARGYQNIFEVGFTYRVFNSTIVNLKGQLYRSPWQNHEFVFVNNIVTELGNNWQIFPDTTQGFWGNFEGDVLFKNNRLPELVNSYTYSQGGTVSVSFCDSNSVSFVDSANGNYSLDTSSVHMNIGNLGVEFYSDPNGISRPDVNGRVDYGAFESDFYNWDSTVIDVQYAVVHNQCYEGSEGVISVYPVGGVPPYTFQITGDSTYSFNGLQASLTAGTYLVSTIDQLQNSTTDTVIITEPVAPVLTLKTINDTIIPGAKVVIESNYREFGTTCFSQDFFQSSWSGIGETDLRGFIYSVAPSNGEYITLTRSWPNGCIISDSIQFFYNPSMSARTSNQALYVDGSIGDNSNSGTATSPFASIQNAIESAIDYDTIYIDSGVYPYSIVNKPLYMIGLDTNVYLSGFDTIRPIHIIDNGGFAHFENLKIIDGRPDCSGDNYNGGAISTWYSDSVVFINCLFKNHIGSMIKGHVEDGFNFINCRLYGPDVKNLGETNVMFDSHVTNLYNTYVDGTNYEFLFIAGNYKIYNSTIVNVDRYLFGEQSMIPTFIVENSIIAKDPGSSQYSFSVTDAENPNWNNWWGDSSYINNSIIPDSIWTMTGSNNAKLVVGNAMQYRAPIFEDSQNGDYRLSELDPGNNVGSLDVPLFEDMNGHPRPDNDGFVDLGAFERDSRLIEQNVYRLCEPGDSVLMWTSSIDSNSIGSILWSTGETSDSIFVSPLNTTTYACVKTVDGLVRYDTTSIVVGGGELIYSDSVLCFGSELSISAKGVNIDLPNDFVYLGTFEGKDIYFIQKVDTWHNQRAYASQYGGDLIVLDSQEKQQYVSAGLLNAGLNNFNVWIGLYQNTQSAFYSEPLGGWEWVNGQQVTYTNWMSGEPNNSSFEDYGELTQYGTWNDHFDWSKRAIVEIPVNIWDPITWSTGDTITSIVVSPLVDTVYYVTTSYAGVSCTDTARIYVNDSRITASSMVVCVGDSISLSVPELSTSGQSKSILWSTGDTTSTIWVSQDSTTSYWVSVGLADAGCTDTVEILTTVPVPEISSSFTTYNLGTGLELSSTSATTYMWSDSTTGSSINVYPSVTTDYWVKVTDTNACVGYDTITVEAAQVTFRVNMRTQIVDSSKGVHLAGNFQGWDPDSTQMYDADGDGIYEVTLGLVSGDTGIEFKYINGNSWSDGHDDNLTLCTNVTSSGDRMYTVPFVNDTLPVYHLSSCDENMPIDPLADAQSFECVGDTTFLDAGPGLTDIIWNTGDTSRVLAATTPGWYWFLAKYPHQVRVYDSTYVNFYEYTDTSVSISGPTSFCDEDSVVLSLASDVTATWSNGSTLNDLVVMQTGNYYATLLDTNGCTKNTDTIAITVWQLPSDTIFTFGSAEICDEDSVTITATYGYDYVWNNGDTNYYTVIKQAGDYAVTITDGNGCVSESDTISIIVNPLPNDSIIISGSLDFCQGDSVSFTSAEFSGDFAWSTGDSTQSITVGTAGDYYVIVTNNKGCISYSDTLSTIVYALPSTSLTLSDSTACIGESVTITASTANQYVWSNGSTTNSISVNQTGVYFVVLSNNTGCSVTSDIVAVTFVSPPTIGSISGNDTTNAIYQNQEEYWINSMGTGSISWGALGGNILGNNGLDTVLVEWSNPITNTAEVYATVTNSGCSVSDTLVLFHTSIGIDELDNTLMIWPNPTQSSFSIEFEREVDRVRVFDVVGREVVLKMNQSSSKMVEIDLSDQPSGVYLIEIHSEGIILRGRIEKI